MGLSSKQVSSDGLGWNQSLLQAQTLELPKASTMKRQSPQNQQQQQQQPEQLKCPRCDSTNTKFCYYNNYNKSQPRHFCKACKRHWTKGGTLRNVPVGGGRKNKRLKTSNSSTAAATGHHAISSGICNIKSSTTTTASIMGIPAQRQVPASMQFQELISGPLPSSLLQQSKSLESKSLISNNNSSMFQLGSSSMSTLSLPQTQGLQFPFSSSSSSSFDTTTPSSISTSFQSPSIYNYTGETTMEDPTITLSQPWQIPISSSGMEMPNYWNWDDFDALVSTDPNIPWDDSEIKP